MKENLPERFNSPTHGQLSWDETLIKIARYISTDETAAYGIIIGTDSQAQYKNTDFVSAIIIHKKGKGGVYFWGKQNFKNLYSLKQRILNEAIVSLSLAEKLVSDFTTLGLSELDLEIHVDIGPNGPTREMIAEVVGMIKANGFNVAYKPSSWGASHVADRHV